MSNEFVTVKREVLEQVVDAAFSTYCSQHLAKLVPALREALGQPAKQPESDKLLRQALEAMEVQGSEWVILEQNAIAAIRKYLGEA